MHAPAASAATTQLAIGDYGLIADGFTCGLVGCDGNLGWLCLPRFDSPSVCAGLLDDAGRGGHLRWAPVGGGPGRQCYRESTNVLVTEFGEPGQRVRITDWMPARFDGASAAGFGGGAVCRWAEAVEGEVELELECAPRAGYGAETVCWRGVSRPEATAWVARTGQAKLWVAASFPLRAALAGDGLRARVRLRGGESAWFVFGWGGRPEGLDAERVRGSLQSTIERWRNWAGQAQYQGPYRDAVVRSALALKALIYAPSGAIVAAATTSLPEAIGGGRNWDYRFCWPRDATFALYGLSLLGYHQEAGRFLEFVGHLCDLHPPPLQVCYRVDGATEVPESELGHLSGYRGSRPVRIGNGAALQSQLDSAGEVLDAAYTYAKWRGGLDADVWGALRRLVDYAAEHWRDPDESIWEVRGGPRHFVYSKVLCWVALDRGLRLIKRYGLPGPEARWRQVRGEIRQTVLRHGYSHDLHAFTQTLAPGWPSPGAPGSGKLGTPPVLDSSLLLMPLLRFCSPHDPRMEATINRIQRDLTRDSLVARYQNTGEDGVGGPEGAFSICTFWLVDCLTLLGRRAEARALFERMLTHAGPLGLFSEEVDPGTGALLGNYPQAFTHMALLNSAHNLEIYPEGVA